MKIAAHGLRRDLPESMPCLGRPYLPILSLNEGQQPHQHTRIAEGEGQHPYKGAGRYPKPYPNMHLNTTRIPVPANLIYTSKDLASQGHWILVIWSQAKATLTKSQVNLCQHMA